MTEDITVKAVWTREAGGTTDDSGCQSSIGGLSACIAALAIAMLGVARKKENID